MSKNKLVVYLAELAHAGFGMSILTTPLGLGVTASYCKRVHQDEIDLQVFRVYDDLMRAMEERPPAVVAFGYFSWNDFISLVAARAVRESCPDALIVFGGANISFSGMEVLARKDADEGSEAASAGAVGTGSLHGFPYPVPDDVALLEAYPEIDMLIHGDAEIPFANIVATCLSYQDRDSVKAERLDGCSSLVNGRIVSGALSSSLQDLDSIPSPYVSGLFSGFLDKFGLVPQIESLRGCPYKCTFCTVGLNSSRLRTHSLDYLKEEILYLKDHAPNKVLRIADPNWGIIPQDVELAEFIRGLYDRYGYPSSLRVYYSAGGPFEHVREMARTLKPLLPLNMSFQSLNDDVLKSIKRRNMPQTKVEDMVRFAQDNTIATSTELISGLPGESLESFRQCFLRAVELRLDSIHMNALYLTKETELHKPPARVEYGIKTKFALIGKDVTKTNGRYVFETDEVVFETTELSVEDSWELHRFRLFGHMIYAAGFLKEIALHCLNYNVTPLDIYDEIVGHSEKYPFFGGVAREHLRSVENLYFDSPQELEEALTTYIAEHGNTDYFTVTNHARSAICKVLGFEEKQLLIGEVCEAARNLFREDDSQHDEEGFDGALETLARITPDIIITPLEDLDEVVTAPARYDLLAWAKDDYDYPLSRYELDRPRMFALVVRNPSEHYDFIERTAGWPHLEAFDHFFATMVSSNMRRYIAYADEVDSELAANQHGSLPVSAQPAATVRAAEGSAANSEDRSWHTLSGDRRGFRQ